MTVRFWCTSSFSRQRIPARLLCSLYLVPATALVAQSQRSRPAPNFESFSQSFNDVRSVRELSDGSVLVVDKRDGIVYHFASPMATPKSVGRVGAGPGEFRSPTQLLAIGEDSTILTDTQGLRWLLLYKTNIVGTIAAGAPVIRLVGWNNVEGGTHGYIYALRGFDIGNRTDPFRGTGVNDADSTLLIRTTLRADRLDTLARMKGGWYTKTLRQDLIVEGRRIIYLLTPLLNIADQAVVCHDGTVVIADAVRGQIRTKTLNRSGRTNDTIQLVPFRTAVSESVKQQLIEQEYPPLVNKRLTPEMFPGWPRLLPEIRSSSLWCTEEGDIVVGRMSLPGSPLLVDIWNRRSQSIRTLTFPAGAVPVGLGRRGLYITVEDNDGLLELRRYRIEAAEQAQRSSSARNH